MPACDFCHGELVASPVLKRAVCLDAIPIRLLRGAVFVQGLMGFAEPVVRFAESGERRSQRDNAFVGRDGGLESLSLYGTGTRAPEPFALFRLAGQCPGHG